MKLGIFTTFVVVGCALGFLALERVAPYNRGQRALREGFWTDLIGYGLVQSYGMAVVISALLYWLQGRLPDVGFRLEDHWPVWAQLILFLISHDLITYVIHRSQHAFPLLWRTHEAHHSGHSVDWLSGIRSHCLEIILYETAKFAPIVLLGASPEIPLWRGMIDSTYGMFIHSNLNLRLGALSVFFNGPELHRWHHANDAEARDKNFATKFAIWDLIFGTVYRAPRGKLASDYGTKEGTYPPSYLGQFFRVFATGGTT